MSSNSKESPASLPRPESNTGQLPDDASSMIEGLQSRDDYLELEYRHSPFSSRWIYGFNQNVPPINLSTSNRTEIFYAASNCGVVYDWRANNMKLLEGHSNMVTCIATDASGRWLATADSGPENVITVWESSGYVPKRTIFNPHDTYKLARLALSADAKYLLTLAYEKKPTLNWWIWSFGQPTPHATLTLDVPKGAIIAIKFNPKITEQFFVLTKREIWIGEGTKIEGGDYQKDVKYGLKIRKATIKGCTEFGRLTCLAYVTRSRQLVASCTRGAVLVFGYSINFTAHHDRDDDVEANAAAPGIDEFRFVKLLKLEEAQINVIASVDDVIITGNDQGEIKFYDLQLRLLYWCQGFHLNSIREISFNVSPRHCILIDSSKFPKGSGCESCPCTEHNVRKLGQKGELVKQLTIANVPTDATKQMNPFVLRDFIICTEKEGIGMVELIDSKYSSIIEHRGTKASAIDVHCEKSLVCVAYEDGLIELIKFMLCKSIIKKDLREHFRVVVPPKPDSIHSGQEERLPSISVTCLKYSPSGLHLACGLDNGDLLFLDPITIEIKSKIPLKATADAICHICYSQDSLTLALSDIGRKVCVYRYDCEKQEWQYVAKHRAHYKPITAVLFAGVKSESGSYRLLSFGEDRTMVEYDVGGSSGEQLKILSVDRVEQSALPLAVLEWPTPAALHSDTSAVLVANDQHKYKIINYNTTMTLKTLLGPRYETPVCKMILSTLSGSSPDYLLFGTKNLIGIQKLPLDGNPYKHMAMLGHPIEILDMCLHEKRKELFTIGVKDSCLRQWDCKYRSVDTASKMGGEELHPYYCLLEGGRTGRLFQEMRDLFYYVQILCQGTYSPAVRRVGDYISVHSLPDLMRTLGFFPSQFEVENLVEEAKYNVYNAKAVSDIGFEDFVKLYLNHRPAFGEDYVKLIASFRYFATNQNEKGEPYMTRKNLIEALTNCGENFSPELTAYLLKILVGLNVEESEEEELPFLPEEITYNDFVSDILGLEEADIISEKQYDEESLSKSLMTL